MKVEQTKFRKVTINVPVKIWDALEERRIENGTSITNEILNLVRFGLKQEQAVDYMPNLLGALNELNSAKKTKK